MLKKIIIASAIIAGGFACGSKGQYTCTCEPEKTESTNTNINSNTTNVFTFSGFNDRQTTVLTEVSKANAEETCLSYEQTSSSSSTNSTSTSKSTKKCTLTSN